MLQEIARLALQFATERLKRGEPHGAGLVVLENRKIRQGEIYSGCEVSQADPLVEHEPVEIDFDWHWGR